MHPIMFRIPLPGWTLPAFWVLLAAAGLAGAAAVGSLVTKNRSGAGVAGIIGGAVVVAAFQVRGTTWTVPDSLPIYSYGVMLGLSLVVGWYLTLGLADRDGLPKETMANCYVVTAVAAVVGSRILYILTNLSEFDSLGSMFEFRRGGLVAYGGFLGGFLGSYFFLRYHRLPLLPWADVAVPSLASGLMITRIGCYLFGCDFGQPLSESAPAWLKKLGTFPHWPEGTLEQGSGAPAWVQHVKERGLSPLAEHSLPVHPTQLYESLIGAGLLTLLLLARRRQRFRGEIFLLFTFAYGVCRYALEILRDDAERGSVPPSLPEHLLIPLGLAIFGVAYVIGFSKRIETPQVRVASQVLAFVPAVAMYLLLKPETFAATASIQYSTSQAVAVTTGFAASVAFVVYYRAALAHPEAAMALRLPTAEPPRDVADEDDEDDRAGDEGDTARSEEAGEPPKKTAGKKKAKKTAAAGSKKKKIAPVEDDEERSAVDEGGDPEDGDDERDGDSDRDSKPGKD
jgi:phosphatidylglycerol:prolipoprotein diacylglycerol transferase